MLGFSWIFLQLLPQPTDMDIHRPNIAAIFIGPDGVEERFPGIDPVGIAHEKFNHIEFLGGEHHQFAALVGIPGVQVQSDVAAGEPVGLLLFTGPGPPQQGI